jgi:hypothetical protein
MLGELMMSGDSPRGNYLIRFACGNCSQAAQSEREVSASGGFHRPGDCSLTTSRACFARMSAAASSVPSTPRIEQVNLM